MTVFDAADMTWQSIGYTAWKAAIYYGPRVLPVWVKIDGEWEEQTDRVVKVVHWTDES